MNQFVTEWMKMTKKEREGLTPKQLRYFLDQDFLKILKEKIILKDKCYRYLLTFTLSPKLNIDEDPKDLEEIVEAFIEDQSKRGALCITYFAYAKEYTKAGQAHWHVAIETSKCLKKNRFQYYTKTYGNLDISKTKGTSIQEALNYISKDTVPTVLVH